MDLGEALWGDQKMGARRLHSLILGLSPDGAFAKALSPETAGWGTTEELLATVAELVDLGNRQFALSKSKKGSKAPKPINIKRPWEDVKQKKRAASPEEISELMGGAPLLRMPKEVNNAS